MACTRSKPSSGGAPSPPMRSALTTIKKAQCNFSSDSRGFSPKLGHVQQAMRIQVADSTTNPRAKYLPSQLSSIRSIENDSKVLEARLTFPHCVDTAQRLGRFPWGSHLVSPEHQEQSSTNITELLTPAELSQPKSAYFVGYSIHRVDRGCSPTQIPEARISEPMPHTAENFQTPMLGTRTDSAAAHASSPHQESAKGFSAASPTTLKDMPTNPSAKKKGAPLEGTHTLCNASRETYRDRSAIDYIESPSLTSVMVQRTASISDSDAVAPCPCVPLFKTRSISSPARAARSDAFLAHEQVVPPKLIIPSFKVGELQASKHVQADERRAALEVATSLFPLNASRQSTLGDDTPPPTRSSLPWQQPPALRHKTNVDDADMMHIHGIGNIQPLRDIDAQERTPTRMRFNPYPDSLTLNPPMLQPRISSGYALKEELDEMLQMARPLAVNYYRFGSPRPINHFLSPTPIKVPEVECHTSTPRQPYQLEPPGILRKAGATCADWRSPSVYPRQHGHQSSTTQSDLLVDLPQATEEEFFLQTPQALCDRTYTLRAGKRLKTSDFDDIVHIADEDFMCLDLLEAFSE